MGQITIDLDDETEARLKASAKSKGLPVSRWVAELVRERTATGWPEEVHQLAGAWPDFPLTPPATLASLIDGFRRHPHIRHGSRFAARLEHLLEISREEQPEQASPATASLVSLTAFLIAHPELAYPTTVLTPDGNVRTQWRRSKDEHFAIEFFGDHDVRFVIFAPDPRHRDRTNRVSGNATVESVMSLAAPYGVLEWATERESPSVRA